MRNVLLLAMNRFFTLIITVALTAFAQAEEPAKPTSHTLRKLEGWTVRVDERLLHEPNEALGQHALASLQSRLADIVLVMQPERLQKIQQVIIQLDLSHGTLNNMQYHSGAQWVADHGFSADLVKCVHIPIASMLISPNHHHIQPWCVLHELAHAYHDQVFGFDEPRIKAAWQHYKASGHGDSVLHVDGHRTKHYALTNPMEFFAEMSESYFGTNDFFPFVHGELQEAEPETYALLKEIWGPLNK